MQQHEFSSKVKKRNSWQRKDRLSPWRHGSPLNMQQVHRRRECMEADHETTSQTTAQHAYT